MIAREGSFQVAGMMIRLMAGVAGLSLLAACGDREVILQGERFPVRADLDARRLVVLPVGGLPYVNYVAVLPKGPRRAAVEQFADWLVSIFRAPT